MFPKLEVTLIILLSIFSMPSSAWIVQADETIGKNNSPLFNTIRKSVATLVFERKTKNTKGFCTAVLVTNKFLVTASHCLEDVSQVGVVINGRQMRVARARRAYDGDLATLELEEPISVDDSEVAPIPIATDCSKLKDGDEVIQAGVGKTSYKNPSDLQTDYGGLRIKRFEFKDTFLEGKGYYAAVKEGGVGVVAPGDSGGPTIIVRDNKPYVCGVVDAPFTSKEKFSGFLISPYLRSKGDELEELRKFSDVTAIGLTTGAFSIPGITDRHFPRPHVSEQDSTTPDDRENPSHNNPRDQGGRRRRR